MRNIKLHIFFCILVIISWGFAASNAYSTPLLKKAKYNYLISVPENYDKEPGKKWPVIFYLHGRHASGTNLKSLERYGLPYFLKNGKKLDFIVISPQCPWAKNWASEDWFNPIYDEVTSKYSIDESRIYLIGISMGGFGTWALANRMPERFAAIAPMCGGADVRWADNLSNIPTWIFHGTADRQIPISRSEVMVKALEKKNSNLKFSRLKNEGHDISRQFNNDELYAWLSQFSTKQTPFWEEPLPILKTIAAKRVTVRPPARQPDGIAAIQK